MSEQIDWSKAPEGTTHYVVGSIHPFEKRVGDDWFYYVEGAWSRIHIKGDDRITSSALDVVPRPTTPSWSGEGLPPVGVVCEVDYCEQWHPCEIIAHFQQRCGIVAAFTVDIVNGSKSLDAFGEGSFRPIRTPEQIAKDDRDAAIGIACADIEKQMEGFNVQLSYSVAIRATIEAMIDKGYRKP